MTGGTIELNGAEYLSESDVMLDGDVVLESIGGLNIASGGNAGDNITVTGTINDPGTNSQLALNSGSRLVDLQGDLGTTTPLGALLIADSATSNLHNVRVDGSLTINSAVVNLQSTSYSSNSWILIDGNVNLSAPGASTIVLQSGADQAVTVGRVQGANDSLQIDSQGNVSLDDSNIGSGDLTVRIDIDDDGRHSGTFGSVSGDQISISGSATGNEIVDFDGPITAQGGLQLFDVDSLTLNHRVSTNGGDLSLSVRNDLTIGSNASITTSGGDIILAADDDADGDGGLFMAPTSSVDSGSGTISITAGEDIALSDVTTINSTASAVNVTSANGSITGTRPDTNLSANSTNAVTTIRAGLDIGIAGPNIFLNAGFQPLITESTELDLIAGGDTVVRDVSTAPIFSRLEANSGVAAILKIEATGDIDLTNTVGLEAIDQMALISDAAVVVPNNFTATRLLLDGAAVTSPGTITADDLVLRSQQSESISLNVNRFDGSTDGDMTIVSTVGPGQFEIIDLDEDTFALEVLGNGNLDLHTNGSVLVTDKIFTSGSGNIAFNVGDVTATNADLTVANVIETNVGSIQLNAQRDIRLVNDAIIDSNLGSISLTADSAAGNQDGEIFMEDGRRIQTQTGEISLLADGNITLSHLETSNSTSTAVSITTTSGGVIDGGDSSPEIFANQPGAVTTIQSATGIGATNALETQLAILDVVNSTNGAISINEVDAIDLTRVVQQRDDSIEVVSSGQLTVLANGTGVTIADASGDSGSGSIRLSSTGADVIINQSVHNQSGSVDSAIEISAEGTNSDISVNAAIDTAAGNISLRASDGIQLTSTGDLTAGGSGNVSLTSNTDGSSGNSAGEILMSDGALIDATAGTISLTAFAGDVGKITLGGLLTTNATTVAVTILTTGSVIDGGDTHVDIVAQQTGARATIDADNGIGAGNTLETSVNQIDITNSATENIEIFEAGDLVIFGIDQTGNVDIRITATGTLTIHEDGTGITIRDVDSAAAAQQIELRALNGDVIIDQAITITGGDTNAGIVFTATGTNSDVIVNAAVSNDLGFVEISADDSIEFTADGDVFSGGTAGITVVANANDNTADSGNQILMQDGALFDAGTGEIELQSIGVDGGSITLGGLVTQNATGTSVLLRTSQSILDGGDEHIDIDANQNGATTSVETVNGFGPDNSIETRVDLVDIENTTSEAIDLDEIDEIRIVRIEQQPAEDVRILATDNVEVVSTGSGIAVRDTEGSQTANDISIATRQGSIDVNQTIDNLSDNPDSKITLDANGPQSDIEINAAITTVSGDIRFIADDRIHVTADGDTTAAANGNVVLIANDDNATGDSLDEILMDDGAIINSQTGTINLSATGTDGGDITLGSLVSENATISALTIESSRGVIDGGDTDPDIVANQTGARTTVRTSSGIGSENGLEVQLHEVVAINRDEVHTATGNIELIESDDLDLIAVDNNANAVATGDTINGVVAVQAVGDVRVIDDGDSTNAALQSENAIELTAQNISIDDDVLAIDDTPGVAGNIDERIEIAARGNFELLAERSVSTDDDPMIRTVTPDVTTQDTISIIADSDANSPIDIDGIPAEGIVYFAETSTVRTDGGVANLLADRPDIDEEFTAFYDSTTIEVSELEFVEVSEEFGNVYQGLLTVKIGNSGEENLIFDVDWGDGRTIEGFANEIDPDVDGKFNGRVDGNKNRYLIPKGGETYVIPRWYTDFDISSNVDNQAGRTEASDSLPVRFSVSQHSPSIEVRGRAIVNPNDTAQASPIVVPTSDDISPLARLSSTDVVDRPTDELPRFDNGITAFTVVTRSVPPGLLKKEVIEVPSVKPIDAAPDPVFADDAVVSSETQTSSVRGGVGSEDFFQLRRTFADGTTDIIIKRISEGEGDQLFDRDAFEKFVADENLDDGSGYEIWLITSDPGGNVPVERPVFEFDITAGKPGPASEELPDKLEDLQLVPIDDSTADERANGDSGENQDSTDSSVESDDVDEQHPPQKIQQSSSIDTSSTPDDMGERQSLAVTAAALLATPVTALSSRFSKRARALRRMQQAAPDHDSTTPAVNP